MWIERTQLKKNSVAFRFGKKCTYTYIVLAIDTLSRVWLQKLEFTQFSEISSRPGKRLYRMSKKNVSIWIFKINEWNTQHFRIYFALCVSTTLCCCTLTFRNIYFKVYDILKCQNFLISFLDEFGNFKQKNFTFQNVKFFYILQQRITTITNKQWRIGYPKSDFRVLPSWDQPKMS